MGCCMASLFIVDDHPAIRMAVKMLVSDYGHEVIGEYDNGVDVISNIRLLPDIIILDINIPLLNGLDLIKRIKNFNSEIKIIVLSSNDSQHIRVRCIQQGASAFISKLDDLTILKSIIKNVLHDEKYFTHDIYFKASNLPNIDSSSALNSLSSRELTVLLSLVRGESNKEIASNLILSEKTVSTYKTRLMTKLSAKNIVELIDFAKKNNLV